MPTAQDTVSEFYRALQSADGAARAAALLTEDVTFMCSNPLAPTVSGRQKTVEAITSQDGGLCGRMRWEAPSVHGETVRITGHAPAGSVKLGYITSVTLKDGKIALIRQQDIRDARMSGSVRPHVPPTAIALPQELKDLIGDARDKNPMVVCCVDPSGQPNMSFHGSIFAYSDDQLAMWIRNPEGKIVECIAHNPKVALMLRDQAKKQTFQFEGRARITTDPVERERVFVGTPAAEQRHDFIRVGAAIIVDLDRVHGYFNRGVGPDSAVMLTQLRGAPKE